MVLQKDQKQQIIDDFKTHANDTGSAVVQVAIITSRMEYLAEHFKAHKKDFGSRRGLLKLIGQRRRLLNYLKENDTQKYQEIITKLNIRK